MILLNCNAYKFKKFIEGKELICFGAGQALNNFLNMFEELRFEENIRKVVDNDIEKWGKNLFIREVAIPIVPPSELKYLENIVILISCSDIASVYEQLNANLELENIACFFSGYIRSNTDELKEVERWYPEKYRLTEKPLIPKKIHYCWFGNNPIPEKSRRCIDSWHQYCPDYEILKWDESNYNIKKNRYMYDAYKAGKWAFVSDYARLDIVYEYGGIYLDTDVEVVKNLDDLLFQDAFVGIDASTNISLGLGFGAKKKFERIRELQNIYNHIDFINADGSLNLTAMPTIQKSYYNELGYINNGEYQIISSITVYPEKVLSAKCNITGRILPTKETCAIHHYDGSWAPEGRIIKQNKIQELYCSVTEI